MALIDKASLLMVPSTYEDGTLYNVLPSGNKAPDETGNNNGYDQTRADFTFSRGSNLAATRRNSSGLIEKGRENLLLQSNQFDTTWTKTNSSITSGQSGYDGSSNAWLLNATSSATESYIRQTTSLTGVGTFSIYAKAGTADQLAIYIASTGADIYSWFNLSTGAIGSGAGQIDKNITSIGTDGWYRIDLTGLNPDQRVDIYVANANGSFLSNSGDTIYIQSAQLEKSMVATDYIESGSVSGTAGVLENAPRIDYSSGAGALLLEPQRTNLTVHSEYLGASDWAKTRCTIEDNSTTSPEGLINSAKMTSTDANESYIQDIFSFTGSTISWSFFAKKGDLDYCHGLVWDLSANGCRQWFNVNDGTVGGATTFGSGYSVYSATIEDYGSGWYRCTMIVSGSSGSNGCRVSLSSANTIITSAVNSYGYFYGLQAEDSTYSSSLIPTYGSAATRGADSCSVTGASDVIGQTEGTAYLEIMYNNGGDAGVDASFFGLKNSAGTTYLNIYRLNSTLAFRFFNAGANQFFHTETPTNETLLKIAFAYKANDFALYINGVQEATDTSGSVAGMSEVHLAGFSVGDNIADNYKTILFNERLSNTELAALTA